MSTHDPETCPTCHRFVELQSAVAKAARLRKALIDAASYLVCAPDCMAVVGKPCSCGVEAAKKRAHEAIEGKT